METALISIVSIALVIISTVTMTMGLFQSATGLAGAWEQMEQQAGDIRQTEISVIPPEDYAGGLVDLTVMNVGQTNLGDFPDWDVITQYESNSLIYLEYSEDFPPDYDSWTVNDITITGNGAECFDPGILNPGEEMNLVINLWPEIGEGDTARITITTPNGVTSTCYVIRPEPLP